MQYLGGKSRIAKDIAAIINKELTGGGGNLSELVLRSVIG